MPTPKPRDEALAALASIQKALADPAPLDGLARVQLAATVEYAILQVEAIEELRRARRARRIKP